MSSRSRPQGDGEVHRTDARHAFEPAKGSGPLSSLLPPSSSSSSSFVRAWDAQRSAPASSSALSASFPLSQDDGDRSSIVERDEHEEAVTSKLLDLSDVPLAPPRRSNHPAYAAPPRTQSTYAHTPLKRPHDDSSFFPASQPLPQHYTEEAAADSDSRAHSPVKPKVAHHHQSEPTAAPETDDAVLAPPAPEVEETAEIIADTAPDAQVAVQQPPESSAPASAVVPVEGSAESPYNSPSALLTHLLVLSPAAFHLSQYHLLLGLVHVQLGRFSSALSSFRDAESAFKPALDLAPAAAHTAHQANLKALQARTSADLALQPRALDTGAVENGPTNESDAQRLLDDAKALYAEALAMQGGHRADLWNELALLLLRTGQLKASAKLYELLLSTYADSADLFVNLSVVRQVFGQPQAAVALLQRVLSTHPTHVAALVNYAVALSSHGLHDESVSVLLLALQLHPSNAVALNALAVEYDALGEVEKAQLCYDKARAVGDGGDGCGAFLSLNTAAHLVRQAREELDEEVRARELEGAEQLLQGELQKEVAGKESPAAALLHVTLGDVCAERFRGTAASADFDKADAEYVEAIRLSADDADAWNQLGLLYSAGQKLVKARDAFVRILRALPSSSSPRLSAVPALNNLALVCIREEHVEQAIALLLLAKDALSFLLPREELALKTPSDAAAAGCEVTDPALPLLLSVLVNLGRAYQLSHDLSAAQAAYERCLTLRPSYVTALNGLSAVHAEKGEWQEAERLIERAVRAADGRHSAELLHNQRTLASIIHAQSSHLHATDNGK